MAKKVKAPGPAVRRGRWLPWTLFAVAVAGGSVAWFGQHRLGTAQMAWLPAAPDVSHRPAELARLLRAAQARVQQESASAESVAVLAGIYHANNFTAEAGVCWSWLGERQPTEARWRYYLSDISRMRADQAGLQSGLEQTVSLAPDYAPAWLELGDLEFKTGQLERAAEAYRQRVRLLPADPYARLGLARIALQQDRRGEGKALIEALVREVPEFPSSHNLYAEILAQENDLAGAANQRWLGTVAGRFRAAPDPWKEALRQWCCDVDQLIVWGAIDFQTRQGDRGQAAFAKAVSLEPDNPQGYENLGMLYLEQGNAAKAAEVLKQGSALPGASEQLFSSLGDAYLALHRPDQALQMADQALATIPGSSAMHNTRGLALAASNRPEEAMAAYGAAMKASPGSAEPVANRGLLLLQLGRRDEARAALEEALQLQPAYVKAARPLAYLKMETGDLPGAEKLAYAYFRQFPGLADARAMMSRYYLWVALQAARRQDPAAVEHACLQGLVLVPESAELMGFLGVTYLQQGRQPDALKALEQSYRLQPADSRVALVLGELCIALGRTEEARTVLNAILEVARQRNDAATIGRAGQLLERLR